MAREINYIYKEIARISAELGLPVEALTRDKFLSQETDVTKRDLEFYGGWAKLRTDAIFSLKLPLEKDGPSARGVEIRNSFNRAVERKENTMDYFHRKLMDSLSDLLDTSPFTVTVDSPYSTTSCGDTKTTVNLLWSDLHFGVDVHSYEVINADYNWTIAASRISKLVQEAKDRISFYESVGHRHSIRVFLNGDILHGVVHLSEANIKPITEQLYVSMYILSQAIGQLSQVSDVEVVCTPGNHDRMTYRGPERAICQRWDSYATMLYLSLRAALSSCKNITFHIPASGLAFVDDLNGGEIVVTHGDTAPHIGNVSKSISTEKLTMSAFKMIHGLKKDISVFLFGHWHTPTLQMLPTGQWVVVNGSLIGSDGYSQNAVGYFDSVPAQIMFDSTDDGRPLHNLSIIRLDEVSSYHIENSPIVVPTIGDEL